MGHGNEVTHHKAIRLFLMAMIPALLPTDHVVTQQLSPLLPSPPLSPSPTLPAPFAPLSSPLSLSYTTSSLRSPLLPSLPPLHYWLTTSHAKYTADETMYPAQTAKVSRFQRMVHMVTCHPFPMRISTRIRSQSANLLHTSPM